MEIKRETCPVCGSDHIVFFDTTYDKHYGWINQTYEVNRCADCNLIFMNPMITDAELFNLYPEDYYSTNEINNIVSKLKLGSGNSILDTLFFNNSPRDLRKSYNNKKVLDIGVGDCSQLYKLKQKGADAYGTEIRDSACDIGNQLGLKITKGTVVEAQYKREEFDYVRSNHSFEHITKPEEFLAECNRILKTGGQLFIGVPNTGSLTFHLFGKNWYYLGVPFHPFSYGAKNLIQFVEKYGFRVQKVDYNGSWVGLVGGIQIMLNLKTKKKSNEGWFWNKLNKIIFNQVARVINLFGYGDCVEVTFVKIKSL